MAIVNASYHSIAGEIVRMPITALKMAWNDGTDDVTVALHHLESESSFQITPVTRRNDVGANVVIMWLFDATLYIPHNDYSSNGIVDLLNDSMSHSVAYTLYLGEPGAPLILGYLNPNYVNSDASGGISVSTANENAAHTFEIESVEYRPRIKMKITANSKDISDFV